MSKSTRAQNLTGNAVRPSLTPGETLIRDQQLATIWLSKILANEPIDREVTCGYFPNAWAIVEKKLRDLQDGEC